MARLSLRLLAFVFFIAAALCVAQSRPDTRLRIMSPDGQIVFILSDAPHTHAMDPANNNLRYAIDFHTKWLMDESVLGLKFDGQPALGPGMRQVDVRSRQHDVAPTNSGGAGVIHERYNAARADLRDDSGRRMSLEIRVYDDGAALRYIVPRQPSIQSVRVERELTEFVYNEDAMLYPRTFGRARSDAGDEPRTSSVSRLSRYWLIGLPLVGEVGRVGWVEIAEARSADYPSLALRKGKPAFGLQAELASSRQTTGARQASPNTEGVVTTSWRVIAIGDDRERVAASDLASRLGSDPAKH